MISARTGIWNREGKIKLFLDGQEADPSGPAGARPAGLGPGQGQGMRRAGPAPMQLEGGRKYAVKVEYTQNGPGGGAQLNWIPPAAVMLAEAEKVAKDSDVTLVFVGLNGSQEGEGHDRSAIDLPEPQESLVKAMIATGKPVVVVLTSGSAVAINSAAAGATAVLSAWYGGEEAGTAIAETLAGVNNPAGRLPVTFYKSLDQVPAFTDYSMKGRTYRYFKGEPLYPFGFGLSYSSFAYSGLSAKRTADRRRNPRDGKEYSSRDGDEVVQLYISGDVRTGRADSQPARIPADSLGRGREPRGEIHPSARGLAKRKGADQRRRRTTRGYHATCERCAVTGTRAHLPSFSSVTSTTSLLCIGTENSYEPFFPTSTTRSVSGRSRVRFFNCSSCAGLKSLGAPISM